MSKIALIFGITGMDGSHLADLLLTKGYTVFGVERKTSMRNYTNIEHLEDKINFVYGDLADQNSIYNCIAESNPDEIYNMAAQSFVSESWNSPEQTSNITGLGPLRILNAIREYKKNIKFFQASSSEMFGGVSISDEYSIFNPLSPYASAKVFAHNINKNYRDSYKMFNCSGILFNHESERRPHEFVTRKITNGIARIYLKLADSISLGNIDISRDWGYAPDYMDAVWLIMQQDIPDDYIICTGITHTLRDFLRIGFNHIGVDDWEKYIKIDSKFFRKNDLLASTGNPSKINNIGWSSKVSFENMIISMIDNDINKLK